MNLNLSPIIQSIIESDIGLRKSLESLGTTKFNIHASFLKLGLRISAAESSILKPHKNPDFTLNISRRALKLITDQKKFDSSMVTGDIEMFAALMNILAKTKADFTVVVYDIFGREAGYVFESFVAAFSRIKERKLSNKNIVVYKKRLRLLQLKIDRVEKLIIQRTHAVN
ncbi:MAG: hypothetical protein VW146_01890 [Gammaproteobacteria bacterium]